MDSCFALHCMTYLLLFSLVKAEDSRTLLFSLVKDEDISTLNIFLFTVQKLMFYLEFVLFKSNSGTKAPWKREVSLELWVSHNNGSKQRQRRWQRRRRQRHDDDDDDDKDDDEELGKSIALLSWSNREGKLGETTTTTTTTSTFFFPRGFDS